MKTLVAAIWLVHSWYPYTCCGEMDCHPIPCEKVIMGMDGTAIVDDSIFLPRQIHPSQDEDCHMCVHSGPLCLFLPKASS